MSSVDNYARTLALRSLDLVEQFSYQWVTNLDYKEPTDPDDTLSIQRALAASKNVWLQGVLTVSGDDPLAPLFVIQDRHTIRNDALITHNTTTGITFYAVNVDDWVMLGNGFVTGAGKVNTTAAAFFIAGCNRYRVYNQTTANIAGHGFRIEAGAFISPRGDNGQFYGCVAYNCWYGCEGLPGTAAEYIHWYGWNTVLCNYGTVVEAGNWHFHGGNDEANVEGFVLLGGANNSHGGCSQRNMNHNTSYNFRALGVSNGWTNTGCNSYADSLVTGAIHIEDSKGISWIGGEIDAPISLTGTTSFCTFTSVCMPGVFSVVSGSRAAYLWANRCYSMNNGPWEYNSPSPVYVKVTRATSAQALVGSNIPVIFNNVIRDTFGNYNSTTGTFTCTVAGEYTFSFNTTHGGGGLTGGFVDFFKNTVAGAAGGYGWLVPLPGGALGGIDKTFTVSLAVGDTVDIKSSLTGTSPTLSTGTSQLTIALVV